MKLTNKVFTSLFLVMGLILTGCGTKTEQTRAESTSIAKQGAESRAEATSMAETPNPEAGGELPWVFGGYGKLGQLHLRYYYVFKEPVKKVLRGEMTWEDSLKDNTGIVDVWFKSDGSLFRLDRYLENLEGISDSSGTTPETVSYDGKTYSLYERIIQKGLQKTISTFASKPISRYDREKNKTVTTKAGDYQKSTSQAFRKYDPKLAVTSMISGHVTEARFGFGFYFPCNPNLKEVETSGLELMKMMKPARYKKLMEGWKVEEKIAGRISVKHYDSPPFHNTEGFQFIDKELGIGLAGYLEGCRQVERFKKTKFEKPKLVFKALVVETTVSNDVF